MGCVTSVKVGSSEFAANGVKLPEDSIVHERYKLMSQVGQGAFGVVFSVADTKKEFSDDEIVVKVLSLSRQGDSSALGSGTDAKLVRKLFSEVDSLRKVASIKYCVKLVDAFCEGSLGYIVMERFDLELYPMLRSHTNLNERTFVPIARDMLAGLEAIHEIGILHRDIKPENFAFNKKSNIVKLLDFGLSTTLTTTAPCATGLVGTAPFMSPELLRKAVCGVKADVWAIGVTLYAILLGEFPYMPDRPSPESMKQCILVGSKLPSFRASTLEDCVKPSELLIKFLESLIDRTPRTRATANSALTDAWFSVTESSCHGSGSLQPSLLAARRVGAFGARANDCGSQVVNPVLKKCQETSQVKKAAFAEAANASNIRECYSHIVNDVGRHINRVNL